MKLMIMPKFTKKRHDQKILRREFKARDQVLLLTLD